MSLNPYGKYSPSSSSAPSPDVNAYDRQQRSHWSHDDSNARQGPGNLVEKFSPSTQQKTYEPSVRSNHTHPWMQGRHESLQGSEAGSLPSYHDSPSFPAGEHTTKTSFRGRLDNVENTRARVYLFLAMTGCMMLIFIVAALIWLKLDIIKKPLVYGLDNKENYTTRTSTVN